MWLTGKLIFSLLLLTLISRFAYAVDATAITLLEIDISAESTSISVNVQSESEYLTPDKNGTGFVIIKNCSVNILGEDHTYVTSFMPFFESIELYRNNLLNATLLKFQLKQGYELTSMKESKTESGLSFAFQARLKPPDMEPYPVGHPIELLPTLKEERKPSFVEMSYRKGYEIVKRKLIELVSNANDEISTRKKASFIIDPAKLLEPEEEVIKSDLKDYHQPSPSYHQPLEKLPEKGIGDSGSEIITIKKRSTLQAIHYSQGRVDKDIITFEFENDSPGYDYEYDESGKIIVNFHNVIIPKEIIPEEENKCSVKGTYLRSIHLRRLMKNNAHSLQVEFNGIAPLTVDIEDYEGIIDIIFTRSENS